MRRALLLATLLASGPAVAKGGRAAAPPPAPRLVLQITVDQLRGDLLARYLDRMGPDGFRWLVDHGTSYAACHHRHANTETVVGHSTLATGADPAGHGMIGNTWYDRDAGRLRYNFADDDHPLLPVSDAAPKAGSGRSPAALRVPTVADSIALAGQGAAVVYSVSLKDRAAIAMAGHAGTALWFTKGAQAFVTSDFYVDAYPAWLTAWNARGVLASYAGKAWTLTHPRDTYRARVDHPSWEVPPDAAFGRDFPHPFGTADDPDFAERVLTGPAGDALLADFAVAVLDAEPFGKDDVVDYLSVSFSSNDLVGHAFGPSSLESEAELLGLDGAVASLLRAVDARVGLDRTVVVLSADHGAPEAPGEAAAVAHLDAGWLPSDLTALPEVRASVADALGIAQAAVPGLVATYYHPYLYLDVVAVRAAGLEPVDVARAFAAAFAHLHGVATALPLDDVRQGRVDPDTPMLAAIRRNDVPDRSGDVYVLLAPYWQLPHGGVGGQDVGVIHGSPYAYDTWVPLVFAGAGIGHRTVERPVATVDVAPTLAALTGVVAPAGAVGTPLVEVLERRSSR
ncbi:MAG: alkaline phosphatase family protein [Alphaproteobacteria bacterium]|nr:alkaline phosphatase family protein [Alphaproteobacteria bacterium]